MKNIIQLPLLQSYDNATGDVARIHNRLNGFIKLINSLIGAPNNSRKSILYNMVQYRTLLKERRRLKVLFNKLVSDFHRFDEENQIEIELALYRMIKSIHSKEAEVFAMLTCTRAAFFSCLLSNELNRTIKALATAQAHLFARLYPDARINHGPEAYQALVKAWGNENEEY